MGISLHKLTQTRNTSVNIINISEAEPEHYYTYLNMNETRGYSEGIYLMSRMYDSKRALNLVKPGSVGKVSGK